MTYLELINHFWAVDIVGGFSPSEKLLYFSLLYFANQLHWKVKELSIANNRILPLTGCSRKTLQEARETLKQYGLIDFKKGNGQTQAPVYIINENPKKENAYQVSAPPDKPETKPDAEQKKNQKRFPDASRSNEPKGCTYIREDKEEKRSDFKNKAKKQPPNAKKIMASFNQICHSLKPAKSLTVYRKKKIQARTKTLKSLKDWENLFQKVENAAFLKGQNKYGWRATFDWLIKNDQNPVKVLEGQYDSHHPPGPEKGTDSELTRGPDRGSDYNINDNHLVEEMLTHVE